MSLHKNQMSLPEGVFLFMTKYLDPIEVLTNTAILNKRIRSKLSSNELQGKKEIKIELGKSITKMLNFKYGEQVCSSMLLIIDRKTDSEYFIRCMELLSPKFRSSFKISLEIHLVRKF